jgi:hypothetical protein
VHVSSTSLEASQYSLSLHFPHQSYLRQFYQECNHATEENTGSRCKIDVGLKHYESHSADVYQVCMLELIS